MSRHNPKAARGGGDNNNDVHVVTGNTLVRAMVLLGLASMWINFRYYFNVPQTDDEAYYYNSEDSGSMFLAQDNNNNNMGFTAVDGDGDAGGGVGRTGRGGKMKRVKKTIDGEFSGGQLVKKDKQGRTVVQAITALKKDQLGDAAGDDDNINSLTLEEASQGREPILEMLQEAGIQDFDAATVAKLPTMDQIEKLYGKGPIVYGLETCETFQKSIPPEEASLASGGIFNSGTNTLAMYMNANCIMPLNKKEKYGGMRWQVPWGKHMVAKRKWTNTVSHDRKVNKTTVMPVITIRDPYSWMQSMCRHPYATKWHHTQKHCPNLVPNQDDFDLFPYLEDTVPVRIDYPEKAEHWDNLAHLWSDWYGQYYNADYPRLIVRFEDLLFNVKEMVTTICECVGGVPRQEGGKFAYVVDSGKFGKGHPETGQSQHTNMISAMVKYGTDKKRFTSMTDDDLTKAHEALDLDMMMTFGYEIPPPP